MMIIQPTVGSLETRRGVKGGGMIPASVRQRPVLLVIDDDPTALRTIDRELNARYGHDYRVISEESAEAGTRTLQSLHEAGAEVAVVLADHQLAGTAGADLLARARQLHPVAKRALLIPWGTWRDRETALAVLRAVARGQADSYLIKPWASPDEGFHVAITGFLYDWTRTRPGRPEVRVVGDRWAPRSHELRTLLQRNSLTYTFADVDSPEGRALLTEVGRTAAEVPVVVFLDGQALVNPTNAAVAAAVTGADDGGDQSDGASFDVVVVGAGPGGLAAAINAASEGLSTLVIERESVGGQAGSSSLIRNYLGFPRGVAGAELGRSGYLQAWVFGVTFRFMCQATALRPDGSDVVVSLSDGSEVTGRAVILAPGVSYRRLEVPGLDALTGVGVFYGAAVAEAPGFAGLDVYVIGGANSAGQAALHLAKFAQRVTLVVRGESLAADMSAYLIQQIEATENIAVRLNTQVVDGGGDGRLERLVLHDTASGRTETVAAAALFIHIGARPYTDWLPPEVTRDERGFIITGQDLVAGDGERSGWPLPRPPFPLETGIPGVFAVGDVRHRSVKRVASAIGEGSVVAGMVHQYLETAT
jgi:thioredoxin reductase (NADPH)